MPTVVRFHELGGPENLKFEQIPQQQPGEGEVRLKVQASGINRAESMYYRGVYLETPRLPSRVGYEVAGIVDAVGSGVDKSWIGKQVATVPGFSQNHYGTLGEEAIVPVRVLAEYPKHLSPVQGAAIWMQYPTAYGALCTTATCSRAISFRSPRHPRVWGLRRSNLFATREQLRSLLQGQPRSE